MENPQSSYLNLKHYVSVMAQLSFQAAQFAKQCAENPNLGKYDKGGNDPVTDADYKIQTYLIKGITHFFPSIRIVGEQTVDYKGQIELNFEKIRLDNYPQEAQLDEEVPLEELCLWIDPIDNTKGFVKGKLEGVTILVGMTRKNSPILGVIATPYRKEQEKAYFSPYLYMGYVPKHKAFRLEGGQGQKWSRIEAPKANNPLLISTSQRKNNEPVDQIATKLNSQVTRFGGSGRKINAVITGSVDAMVYINTGNCRWDSCAGEAIVKAMGGVFTNQLGKDINYDANAQDYRNSEGNVCAFSHDLHKGIVDTYAQMSAQKH